MNTPSDQSRVNSGLSENLEYWMTNLPSKLKTIPIIYLAIPGSHNSFTNDISTGSDLAPDAEDSIRKLAFLGPVLKHFIVKWSITQSLSATDQLKNGIRYFDLRIGSKSDSEDLFIVHGLYSSSVQKIINEIEEFLETHPQEIIILDFQHFYGFSMSDHEKLQQMIYKAFGAKLLPYSGYMNFITLQYMTQQYKYQIIVVYRSDTARYGHPLMWPSNSFPNPWPETYSKSNLISILDTGLQNKKLGSAYVTQCILTPTAQYIMKYLYSSLKKKCAIQLHKPMMEWIERQTPGEQGMNIIIADFVELNDCRYVKEVISLNADFLAS